MLKDGLASEVLSHIPYSPTPNQKELAVALCGYLTESRSSDIFILNGYAGTGKSTVIAAFTKMLTNNNIKSYIIAPTGRAAKVVSGYSGGAALTIHKKIYRQKSISEMSFVLDYNREREAVYIVDEASMIGTSGGEGSNFGSGDLLNDLVEYVRSGTNCRLIMVGDVAQLPPIGRQVSPALDPSFMEYYGGVHYFSMTDIIRQAETSGVLMNATICRSIIEGGEAKFPNFNLNFPDVKAIGGMDVIEEIESAYSRYGKERCVVITRSNKQAGRFNRGVRDRILFQEEELSSNDLIMIVKNNYSYKKSEEGKDSEVEDFIANGDVALVRRVRRYEEVHGFRFADITMWLSCNEDEEMDCKVLLDTLANDSPALSYSDNEKLLRSVEQDYAHIANKRERYKAMRQDPYLNALQIKFAYAITGHKSQGGEWDAVFIDRMIFGEEEMSVELLRWLYTAITRATKELFFINFDDRFFND